MGINRAPFNALIDDTGNGTSGSVWNKAAIQSVLLDPIDANPAWINVPFSAANFEGTAPMGWAVTSAAVVRNRYAVVGKILYRSLYLSWFSGGNTLVGAPSPSVKIYLPAGLTVGGAQNCPISYTAGVTGVPTVCGLTADFGGSAMTISKSTGGNFALADVPGFVTTVVLEIN